MSKKPGKVKKIMALMMTVACFAAGCGKGTPQDNSAPLYILQEKPPYDPATDIDPLDLLDMPQDTEPPVMQEEQRHEWNEQVLLVTPKGGLIPHGDALFQIKSVVITRKPGERDRDKIGGYAKIEHDENGNLTRESHRAFLFLTMEVVNTEDTLIEEWVEFPAILMDPDGSIHRTGDSWIYLDPWAEGRRESQRYYYRLKPGERRTYEVGVLLDTEKVAEGLAKGQTLYYFIGCIESKMPYNQCFNIQKFWDEFCEEEGL